MSFSTGNNYCDRCGKPLGIFDSGLCAECDKALEQEATKQREKELAEEWKCGYEMGFEEAKVFYEKEPCEDVISRNDMLDAVGHGTTYTSLEVQKIINGLPSVNPVPCDDVVSRQAIEDISRFDPLEPYNSDYVRGFIYGHDRLLNEIRKLPSVRPKEQTGHWKRISMDRYTTHAQYWYECDKCGEHNLGNTDFCPNCGARMEKYTKGEN